MYQVALLSIGVDCVATTTLVVSGHQCSAFPSSQRQYENGQVVSFWQHQQGSSVSIGSHVFVHLPASLHLPSAMNDTPWQGRISCQIDHWLEHLWELVLHQRRCRTCTWIQCPPDLLWSHNTGVWCLITIKDTPDAVVREMMDFDSKNPGGGEKVTKTCPVPGCNGKITINKKTPPPGK